MFSSLASSWLSSFVGLVAVASSVNAATYSVSDTFIGPSFLSGFRHENIPDPTHGRVTYVDQATAVAQNLTYANGNTFIIRADYKTTLNAGGPGRNSVRVISNKQWTTHVIVANVRHMPVGCSTWPAFWTTGANWPNNGEVDIIEGVNDQSPNHSTLHTTDGCTMNAANMVQTGALQTTNCFWQVNGNAGCGVANNKPNSYGPGFNNIGGGWYAMERTSTKINVWFWGRNEANVPADVKNGASTVNTSNWGTPYANFVNNNCPINSKFGPNNIIINLTLCGDWAGNVYPSTCPSTCVDFVNKNPAAFRDAYWDFASLRVYQ
ncbi:hypothetical protein FRC02_009840 [Tulasnella sp. 418]|nr:hypothetical protein FRC02_009840 [Tulasnella sp. 418]